MSILNFDDYNYTLTDDGSLNITNEDHNSNVPMSFALSVFHQDKKTIGLFSHNKTLTNTTEELDLGPDFSGNLTVHVSIDTSGERVVDVTGQTVVIYYEGETFTTVVDSSSNISYVLTSSSHADASGYYSATINDVHIGKFVITADQLNYTTPGTNIVLDGSGCTVTFPIENNVTATRTHAVSMSSYVSYVDLSGNIS